MRIFHCIISWQKKIIAHSTTQRRSRHSLLILVERGRHYVYLGGGELSLKDSKLHSRNICLGSHAKCNITSAQDAGAELRQSWDCTGAFKLSQLFKQADDA